MVLTNYTAIEEKAELKLIDKIQPLRNKYKRSKKENKQPKFSVQPSQIDIPLQSLIYSKEPLFQSSSLDSTICKGNRSNLIT